MDKSMGALSRCPNDHLKLRIISARNPEVVAGYKRAWPGYFGLATEDYPIPLSRVHQTASEWLLTQDPSSLKDKGAEPASYLKACGMLSIPLITVRWPGDELYKEAGIPATPDLLSQLGDFAEVKRLQTTVRLYHTPWLIIGFNPPAPRASSVFVRLAPLECIDLDL